MRRYEGFLRPAHKPTTWPARWWIVAVGLELTAGTVVHRQRQSQLVRWDATILDCDGHRCVARSTLSGRTAGDFWARFHAQKHVQGSIYVISPRALMAWQVLGVWRQLESGTVRVQACGAPATNTGSGRQTCGSAGLLLTGDPPTAGRFIHDASQLSFSWVCAGNYGLQPLSAGVDSAAESRELGERVETCSRVLSGWHLGGWSITAGGIALRGWLSTYEGPALYVSSGRHGDALEMSAVAGGLLLARPTGEDPVQAVSVDARSMYPHLCARTLQGVDLQRRALSGAEAERAVRGSPYSAIARVLVETDVPYYPQRTETGIVYPTGRYITTLVGPELEEALRRSHVRSIIRANVYAMGSPLEAYQRRVWDARKMAENGPFQAAGPLVKRLGVALVGKLAQRSELWRECIPDITDPLWGSWDHYEWDGTRRRFQSRAGITEVCVGTELCSHAIPSIPLWVWSAGRVRMWNWIEAAGLDSVYYADTDGLLLSPDGYARLQNLCSSSGDDWGMLRHVAGPSACVVRGPKDFTLGERLVMAGRPRNQRQSPSQLSDAAWYRLPWDHMHHPEWDGCWVERAR